MTTLAVTVSLQAGNDGKLHFEITPPDEGQRFTMKSGLLVVRVWNEALNIVRCSLHHPASGATAYVQGSDDLIHLWRLLDLELHS